MNKPNDDMKIHRFIKTIQAIRALAFIEIFIAHAGYGNSIPSGAGVTTFFVLSGFCMAIKYLPEESTLQLSLRNNTIFALNHVRKIFPLHLIIWCLWILRSIIFHTRIFSIGTILNIFLLQSLFADKKIYFSCNAVTWYLSTYMFICILLPNVLFLLKKASGKAVALIMACSFLMIVIIGVCTNSFSGICSNDTLKYIYGICPVSRFFDVVLGVGGGWMFLHTDLDKVKENYIFMLEIVCIVDWIVVILFYKWVEKIPVSYESVLLFILPAVSTIYVFAFEKGIISKWLGSNKILIYVGNISPYTYLIHLFLLDLYKTFYETFILPITQVQMNNILRCLLCFIATIALAQGYVFIKKEVRSWLRRKYRMMIVN